MPLLISADKPVSTPIRLLELPGSIVLPLKISGSGLLSGRTNTSSLVDEDMMLIDDDVLLSRGATEPVMPSDPELRKLPAMIVLFSVRLLLLTCAKQPPRPSESPSAFAWLFVMVLLVSVPTELPQLRMPPPSPSELFPDRKSTRLN